MSAVEEKVVNQLQEIMQLWNITYNVAEEKYVAKTNSMIVLDAEQLEWIRHTGLQIFSIQKYEDSLTIKFSSGGCSS